MILDGWVWIELPGKMPEIARNCPDDENSIGKGRRSVIR